MYIGFYGSSTGSGAPWPLFIGFIGLRAFGVCSGAKGCVVLEYQTFLFIAVDRLNLLL